MDGISCNVEITKTERFGRILVSKRGFKSGEVVFFEEPILLSLKTLTTEEESFLRLAAEKSGLNLVDDFRFLKSFGQADFDSRAAVLDCYTPPMLEVRSSHLLVSLLKVADLCKEFPWSADVSVDTLRRVVLIKACNAHGFFSQSASSAALYTYGSKMRHSCKPNVVYTSQRRAGVGSFVAKRNIAAGEELFISYIDVYKSVPMRARELSENYLFRCECPMCTTGVDRYRGIPCECGGTMFRNQSDGIWTCELCSERKTDVTKTISNQTEDALVEETLKFLSSFQVNARGQLVEVMSRLRFSLGESHAITKMTEKAYIESQILISMSCVRNQRATLVALTDSILEWTDNDPSFLDSSLVVIACALGRIGEFATAVKYLNPVKTDMEILFGTENENEALDLVNRALAACIDEDRPSVPDLV